jgi:hypothetical protein
MKKSIQKTKSDRTGQMKSGISGSNIIVSENRSHSLFLQETHTFNESLIKFTGK